jgi:hypothetical protein
MKGAEPARIKGTRFLWENETGIEISGGKIPNSKLDSK